MRFIAITFDQFAQFGVFLNIPNDNCLQYSTADIVAIVFIIAEIFFLLALLFVPSLYRFLFLFNILSVLCYCLLFKHVK